MKFFLIKSTLLLLLLIAFAEIKAQDKPFLVGFRYGFSLPMGQFASHEYKRDNKEYGAYALLGTTFSVESAWYSKKRIGFGVNYSVSYYPIAIGYYLIDKDSAIPEANNFRLKSSPYEVRTFMAGALYRLPISKRFNVSFKGMGGLFWAKSPDQVYQAFYFMIGDRTWSKTSAISLKGSFLVGATINFKLFDHVDLLIESEFTYAKSGFAFWNAAGTTKTIQIMKMPLFKVQPGLNITF